MLENLKSIFENKLLLILALISLGFLLLSLILILWNQNKLVFPLIFAMKDGFFFDGEFPNRSLILNMTNLWEIFILGFLSIIINFFLAEAYFNRFKILAYLIFGLNSFISLLLFLIFFFAVRIN